MPPSSLPPSPLRHSLSRKHKAYSPYHQSAPHFHRKCGALFGIVGARRGMFSFDTKREPEKCGAPREKFLLAASVQRRSAGPEAGRGVPTPPSLPLDSTHPATGQGLLALDNPKEEVEAQKSYRCASRRYRFNAFFASPFIAPQSLRDRFPFLSPAVTSSPGRGKSALSGERAPAPSAALSQKAALHLPFPFTTPSVKIAFGAARRPRQTRNKNNPSAENIQSVSGGYSKSFFLCKRAASSAIVGTFDDSNKKSP